MRYAKKGRPEYWPEFSTPGIPISSRTKSHSVCTDEIIKKILDVQSDDSSPPFPLDRRKLKIALYENWYQGASPCDSVSSIDKLKNRSSLVIGADVNACSPLWSEVNNADKRGRDMEQFLVRNNLVVIKNPSVATYRRTDFCEGVPEPIALDSLEDIIKSLKPLKAPGPDGIVSLVIQKNFGVLSPTLLKIYNACLSLKYFPRAWKEANVIVLLKRGKSNDGISSSYRPISLLSHLGKVLEKIILNRVFETNLESEWVSNEQFGFVKNRSTIDALDKLVVENG
ncbi:hypothetical protein QYM36_014445 [Artemia franciscana]|uniref:Uncharacterized protein n=1 Tax=Artemia franciscana TaxID=6661 RepID=A0AA88L5L7_ARTSF|nr:hypothetical protein QYM36_014445 [Artemia franciscana]